MSTPVTRGAAAGEADDFDAGAAAHVEHVAPAPRVEIDQSQQMVQLLEVIRVEIGKEVGTARRVPADVEIVDVRVPVSAHGARSCRASAHYYVACSDRA